jgi:chaperonin cofactor prefoldin
MLGNLADLAATGLASEPTIRKWIAAQPDQPWIIKRGSNGDAYEIDIKGAILAWNAEEARKTEEARKRAEDLRQLGLDLGVGVTAQPMAGFSIAERKQLLEEEVIATKLAEKRRELVPFVEVVGAIGDILSRFQQRQATFTARLAKKIDLTRDQLTAIERLMHDDQQQLATMMENWSNEFGDGAHDPAAALGDPAFSD